MNKGIVSKIGFTLFSLLILSFVIGIFFLCFAGFFDLVGVKYDSYFSLFLFVFFYFILGFILDLFANAFISLSTTLALGKLEQFLTRMIIDSTFNWIAIFTVDEFMTSISIPLHVEIVVVLIMFAMNEVFDDKHKKKRKKE